MTLQGLEYLHMNWILHRVSYLIETRQELNVNCSREVCITNLVSTVTLKLMIFFSLEFKSFTAYKLNAYICKSLFFTCLGFKTKQLADWWQRCAENRWFWTCKIIWKSNQGLYTSGGHKVKIIMFWYLENVKGGKWGILLSFMCALYII